MATIRVLEHFQSPTDTPTRRIKRSGGHTLARQGRAYWIIYNLLLHMLPERDWKTIRADVRQDAAVSGKLEPVIDRRIGVIAQSPSTKISRHIGFTFAELQHSADLGYAEHPGWA